MPTNTKEAGFETLIVKHLTEVNGYEEGKNSDYNKDYAIDETRLFRFLNATQPDELEKLGLDVEANKIIIYMEHYEKDKLIETKELATLSAAWFALVSSALY